ncbi:unnamed protein product [Acanthoscelides obtectus]|uniref:PiggyBac transposable element-derived protein domain-containing protein n=1 Tax=Acanthoscelides obtectus TaxID=200917 RepID=A0A9P0PCS4_ACAOB|nr:unnamed protein product [Acanthoscelides obtectus]CAK1675105.1 PiggyBac transposable element-derived protein 3 [Acanthoscelides obtectus]
MDVTTFYGKGKNQVVILPSEDPTLSDADFSGLDDDNDLITAAAETNLSENTGNVGRNHLLPSEVLEEDSDGFDDEDLIPLAQLRSQVLSRANGFQMHPSHWKKQDIVVTDNNNADNVLESDDTETETSLTYFYIFFTPETITLISSQTNLYSVQVTGNSINTNDKEIQQFIGILVFMGVIEFPSYTDYWSQQYRYDKIAHVMSLKRFQKLRRFLYFADNHENQEASTSTDRLYKIRPLLNIVRFQCRNLDQESHHSIDEMMIPHKGTRAGNLRQYIQNKPHKWGYKFFKRCGVSGIIYDFVRYTFRNSGMIIDINEEEQKFGIGG